MRALISPAKKLDFSKDNDPIKLNGELFFAQKTSFLVKKMKTLKAEDLSKLMSLSTDLSTLNFERYQNFEKQNSRAACFAFAGDTYQGLKIETFNSLDLEYAKENLFILSGLYGLLRVNDAIKPYRLEMGVSLKQDNFANLYQYWSKEITTKLNELNPEKAPWVNLASQEYFKAVDKKELTAPCIDVHFVQEKNNKLVSVGLTSKRARGSMARFIVKNKVRDLSTLYDFEYDGHKFNKELSNETQLYFKK